MHGKAVQYDLAILLLKCIDKMEAKERVAIQLDLLQSPPYIGSYIMSLQLKNTRTNTVEGWTP